ncbi:MAG: tetratricopeptide (TPR) repeat protein [Polaribacter sp.]|jgi:tetratricopeptide (TPR) repeat protein
MVYKTQIRMKMKQFSFTRTNMRMLVLVQLLLAGTLGASAQDFGADPDKCKENLSLYREYYKQKNYEDALPGWRWVFANCPSSSKNIVINGPKVIAFQINKNKENPEVKKAYIDTLMMVYDKRIELYPEDKGYALGKKGMDQYKYAEGDFTLPFATLSASMKASGMETDAYVLMRLYTAGMKMLKAKQIEMDAMYELYDEVSAILEHQIKQFPAGTTEEDKKFKKVTKAQSSVDQNFERIAKEDQYIALMQPKVEVTPDDANLLEKVTNMMVKRKWTSNPFYLDASEKLYKIAPSAVAAYNLYEGHWKKGNSEDAVRFLEESIKLEVDNNEKAIKLLKLAKVEGSQKSYSKARSTAKEAAGLKAGWGEPHLFIGSLYLSTAGSCGSTVCDTKYGIWAAEDMFNKAKSVDSSIADEANKKLASCKKYYPVAKDCFFEGIKAGDKVKVGGWIGVETTARIAA